MRFANQVWQRYKTDGQFQDIVETLGAGGVLAGAQAITTDMSPAEIAVSTGLGMVAALAARPALAQGGFALGKKLDRRIPDAQDHLGMLAISSPRGRAIYKGVLEEVGGKSAAEKDIILKLLEAKGNQNYVRADGTQRGAFEGLIGGFGRKYGDNLAQGAVAIGTPFLLGNSGSETDETGQGYIQ